MHTLHLYINNIFHHISVCNYQVHHHVHWADFVWVHFVEHLLHLLKRRPHGSVMTPTLLNELLECFRKESKVSFTTMFIKLYHMQHNKFSKQFLHYWNV